MGCPHFLCGSCPWAGHCPSHASSQWSPPPVLVGACPRFGCCSPQPTPQWSAHMFLVGSQPLYPHHPSMDTFWGVDYRGHLFLGCISSSSPAASFYPSLDAYRGVGCLGQSFLGWVSSSSLATSFDFLAPCLLQVSLNSRSKKLGKRLPATGQPLLWGGCQQTLR